MMITAAFALLSTAAAGDLQLGVGVRSPQDLVSLQAQGSRAVGGAQGLVRYDLGWLALEADIFANPFLERYTDLDAILVQIAAISGADEPFAMPVSNEVATLQLLVDLAPPLVEWSAGQRPFSGGPHLMAGFWGGARYQGSLVHEPQAIDQVLFSDGAWAARGGPALGLGVDAWFKGRVGLRLSWLARVGLAPSNSLSGGLQNYNAFTLDLLVDP